MFTAFALLAFSGMSMANTIADEEVKSVENLELVRKNCAEIAATKVAKIEAEFEAATETCFSSSVYNQYYNFFYTECQG